MKAMVAMMSWNVAKIAATPKRHSKRQARYSSVVTKEINTAITASVRSSAPTRGPMAIRSAMTKLPAPSSAVRASLMRWATAVASESSVVSSLCARIRKSVGDPYCVISAPPTPARSTAARTRLTSGASLNSSCISVPPVNSME